MATCFDVAADDVDGLVSLVERERVELAVVGPRVRSSPASPTGSRRRDIPYSDPRARPPGSRAPRWAKDLCDRYGIPAAGSLSAATMSEALGALDEFGPPYVVKVDGLAAGKGVVVTEERDEAVRALELALVHREFGDAGSTVVVEEHLSGREVSAFALADGTTALPLGFAQDFKRVDDDEAGPNTGGMGAYSPFLSSTRRSPSGSGPRSSSPPSARWPRRRPVSRRAVRRPDAHGSGSEGARVQLSLRRPGDPGPDARLGSEPAELLLACARGDLGNAEVELRPGACVTVVLASGGYPGRTRPGS